MATESQYAFFRALYEEEERRAATLADHAKSNLALATLYSAFILFAAKELPPSTLLSKSVFIAAVLSMLGAFLGSLWATQIAVHEALSDPAEIVGEFGDTPPADAEFFDDRIVDYTVAYERNSAVNDRKANRLQLARYCLLAGITLHACYFLIKVG